MMSYYVSLPRVYNTLVEMENFMKTEIKCAQYLIAHPDPAAPEDLDRAIDECTRSIPLIEEALSAIRAANEICGIVDPEKYGNFEDLYNNEEETSD